jgi:hypothetical protein
MGRLRVVWIINLELQGGSPRLCRLRPASVGSEWASIWNVLKHTGHMESPILCIFVCRRVGRYLTSLHGASWVYNGIVFGPPSAEAYAWKTTLGWGRTQPGILVTSLMVATRGAPGPACVMLSGLYPCKVDYWFESLWHPRTWVMDCSPNLNVELSTS